MGKRLGEDAYWPLGAIDYAAEVRDEFSEEAELLGVITILWNRQELALKRLFETIVASKRPTYAAAVWDIQPTHQARRNLLALALQSARLTKRQAQILGWVVGRTKTVSDRRNELIHAEYVVEFSTNKLHAKVKAPRSNKPAKHQPVAVSDLSQVTRDLDHLLQATEAAWFEFAPRTVKRLQNKLNDIVREMKAAQLDL